VDHAAIDVPTLTVGITSTESHAAWIRESFSRSERAALGAAAARYVAGVVALGFGYYAAAKGAQSLRYTASVSAIWPPAGFGIAALYLAGLRWWPGIFLGELLVNGDLLASGSGLPVGSLIGQQTGNMAEVIVGALLLRRLIGQRAGLDRTEQVGGMLLALGTATAISATVGTVSMLAGGVISHADVPSFWRTWWLGDSAGALVSFPLVITWAHAPVPTWRKLATWEGGLLMTAVVVLAVVSVSINEGVTYMVFPALIWAAFRFGPAVAALSTAIAAVIAIGITAHDQGAFFRHPIDERVLSTQLYILVAALTTLFLSAVVAERRRSAAELVDARLRQEALALEERHRIARDLHDSVSQALFSTVLHTRTAQRALARDGEGSDGPLGHALTAIGELTRGAQGEMRALISELGNDAVADGLVAALSRHSATLGAQDGVRISVEGPETRLLLDPAVETQLFGIAREALTNVAKHAEATTATVLVEERAGRVMVEISDNGRGFDPTASPQGHYGLDSMRSRAAEIDAVLTITSTLGNGAVVRVEVPQSASVADDSRR
jgi:signal transduction histidine kinase